MTDRTNALIVVLDKATRVDDVESLRQAIAHMRGVVAVEPEGSDSLTDGAVAMQTRNRIAMRIYELSQAVLRGEDSA